MEEITIQDVQELLDSNILDFRACQSKICFPHLKRMHRKMQLGVWFNNIQVADNNIVEGHHRYICRNLLNYKISISDWSISRSTVNYDWSDVEIDNNDWYCPIEVKERNENDSKDYGIYIEDFYDV